MLKKTILLPIIFLCLFNLNAQEKNNIMLGVDAGFLIFSNAQNLAVFLNAEPKIKASNNALLGLRMSTVINSQTFNNNSDPQFTILDDVLDDHGFLSVVPTFDYVWNEIPFLNKYYLRPYLGLGAGPYLIASSVDVFRNATSEIFEVAIDYKIGLLLRGGVGLGKSRLGLEYNLIPKTDIKVPGGQKVGTVDSSYLGLSVGFTFGASKNS